MITAQVLSTNNPFLVCAEAASMSYGKDLSDLSHEEVEKYVKRIWDKHTNVSEHFVQTIKFMNIPRILTLLIALQRDGFTMTEMSQRRRVVTTDNEEYHYLLKNQRHEDARKVLSVLEPSECVITMNREAARNISATLLCYQEDYEIFSGVIQESNIIETLKTLFSFTVEEDAGVWNVPEFCPEICEDDEDVSGLSYKGDGFFSWENRVNLFHTGTVYANLPMYSFHQFIRHRKVRIKEWGFLEKTLGETRNDSIVCFEANSDDWARFVKTRSGQATQEPLRSFAKKIQNQGH